MKYKIDHDYHIHTKLSKCSSNEEQNCENILKYAKSNHYKSICITDHLWDIDAGDCNEWYQSQDFNHICKSLPLPKDKDIQFYFGCEADMDKNFRLGLTRDKFEKLDFIIVSTTHLHHLGFTIDEKDNSLNNRKIVYLKKIHKLLEMDLPFYKMGIGHITCNLMAPSNRKDHLRIIEMISDREYEEVFMKTSQKKIGIELNFYPQWYDENELKVLLRPYKIAKNCGNKFYLGSDSHHPNDLSHAREKFERIIDLLELEEEDKFILFKTK